MDMEMGCFGKLSFSESGSSCEEDIAIKELHRESESFCDLWAWDQSNVSKWTFYRKDD